MKKISLNTTLEEYESKDQLGQEDQELVKKAEQAALGAYAPYSRFNVGAAILLESGETVLGSNQENASYPTGTCAERVALFAASANYPSTKIKAIAVVAQPTEVKVDEVLTPCGSCRQVIAEYEVKQKESIRIIMAAENGKVLIADGIDPLLPLKFDSSGFKIGKK
jgi:cytidine deaminase